jgi:RNA polymerase sigma factor (sigma-70 family)
MRGEEDAFRLLVQRHEKNVYYLVWRMVGNVEDARDLTQEAFVKVFRALDQFDLNRSFSFWINKIATNVAIDFLRKRRMRLVSIHADPEDPDRPALDLVDGGPSPHQNLEEIRQRESLAALIERLAPHYRVVVHLRHIQQRSYDEISELLDLPLGTVKARLHRAHNQLRAWLQGEGELAVEELTEP